MSCLPGAAPPQVWAPSLPCAARLAAACAGAVDAACAEWNTTWVAGGASGAPADPLVPGIGASVAAGCVARTVRPAQLSSLMAPAVELGATCVPARLTWDGLEPDADGVPTALWAVYARAAEDAWYAQPLENAYVPAAAPGVYAVVSRLPARLAPESCAHVSLNVRDVAARIAHASSVGEASLEERCMDSNEDGQLTLEVRTLP